MRINKQTRPFKKYCCSLILSFNPFWVFLRVQNSAWDFLGFHFGSLKGFGGGEFASIPGDFFGGG